jgi:hypothetical protein
MLASFQPARCNSEVFLDSHSNDLILRGYSNTQHILIGFGSNVDSAINISKSNLSILKGAVYASNIGIGTSTPAANMRLHVSGDARIEGNMIVNGTVTNINTEVRVTDQFSICNDGTGPALIVTQTGAQPIVEFRDDNKVVFKVADGGFITIGSNLAETKLDVEGHATVRGTIYTSNVVTSNVETSSLTSTISRNLTTITSNLYSSNLIVNNQVIINSNGIITNSNYLPPFNTSNVVAGQFTSNFIKNDNIVSSKLESNLVLKGTTTMSSNVFINNGDLKILGSNNYASVGDQARLYLGSNDYFMTASKGVGLAFQVPGTTYPVLIENSSGFMGLGTMDPQENLHVKSNVKVEGSTYVMTKLAVGNSNPETTVDITGTVQASDSTYLLDDLHIMSNNGAWSTQAGRQLYLRYSTNATSDASYIQSIDRSTQVFYNMALEASNIALGKTDALGNPTIYAQYGGRVGMGTSNPLYALHVLSNSSTGVVVAIDNSNTNGWTGFVARNTESSGNGGMRIGMLGSTFGTSIPFLRSGGFIESDGSNGMSIASTSNSGEIRFYTGGRIERVRMTSNGLVGIATSTPTETLQINGKLYTTTQILGSSNDTASVPSFTFKEDSNTGIFHASNDAIGFTTAGAEKMRIDTYGNVGLGLDSPIYRLDVAGDIHTSNNNAIMSGTTSGFLRLLGSVGNTYIQSGVSNASDSASPLIFSTINNITEWARFDSNGKFGLGTKTPGYKFDVLGQANITNSDSNSASFTVSNNLSPYMQVMGSNSTLTFGATGSNTNHSTDALIGDVVIKNQQVLNTGRLLLQTGSGVSGLVINSNNYVGIGTVAPITRLDVTGNFRATQNINADAKISFSNNQSTGTPSIGIQGGSGDKIILWPGTGTTHPYSIGINTFTMYHSVPLSSQYIWYNNGTVWMTLSNGMLGMGTNTQTEKIQVSNGKIYSDTQHLGPSNDTATLPSFSFKEDSNTGLFHPSNDAVGITTGGTEKMRVDANGFVGIGVVPTTYKLDVMDGKARITGDGTGGTLRIAPNTSSNESSIGFYTNSNLTGASAGDYWVIGQNTFSSGAGTLGIGTPTQGLIMSFSNNGYVGIGTNAPTEELHVSSKIFAESQILASSNDSVSIPGFSFREDSNTGIFHPSNDALAFTTGGVEQMRIMHNGNVGIGLSNPSYRLDISGNSRFMSSNNYIGYQASRALNLIGINAVMRIWRPDGGDPSVELISGTNSNDGLSSGNVVWDFYTSQGKFMIRDRTPTAGNGVQRLTIDDIGYVGIGTNTPTEKLHVASGKIFSDQQHLGTSNDNASIPSFSFKENSNTGMFMPSNNALGFSTSGTEKLRINSNGDVGIGTSNQRYRLDVLGDVNITSSQANTPSFTISNNLGPYMFLTGSNATLTLGAAGSNTNHSTDAMMGDVVVKNQQVLTTGKLILQTGSGTSALVINSNNTVGIGTVNPTAPLMISSKSTNSPTTNGLYVYNSNNSAGNHAIAAVRVAGASAGNPYLSYDIASVNGWSTGIDNADGDKFKIMNTWDFSANPKLTIDTTGAFGINTTSPTQTLDVVGTGIFRMGNGGSTWTSNQLLFSYLNQTTYKHAINTRHNAAGGVLNSIDFLLWDSNINSNSVGTKNTMSVTAAGVGINTYNPNFDLDVIGNAHVTNTIALDSNLRFNNSNTGQRVSFWHSDTSQSYHGVGVSNSVLQIGVPTTTHSIQFGLHSNSVFSPLMKMEGSGNIGIGTTSPIAKLHINGDVLANSNVRSSAGTMGPAFVLVPENAYMDVSPGNQYILNSLGEAGNPATGPTRPLFYGSSFLYQDASGEDMKWNYARLLFRGCPLSASASTSVFAIQDFVNSRTPQYSNITANFTLSNDGSDNGYLSYGTPWFGVSTASGRSLALNLVSNSTSSTFRIGQVQIQFKT